MPKIFNINAKGFYVLFLSIISGSPSNAKYIHQLLDLELINKEEAQSLLKFTHFINPLFVMGYIGINHFKNIKIGIIILISHYLGNLIIAIIFKNHKISHTNIPINTTKESFIKVLKQSITDTINTLILILGIVTSCLIFTTIINQTFHINPLFNGILEVTQGINYILSSNIKPFYQILIITFFISFGGLSIHMQVLSILEDKKIRYLPYFLARIIHSLISVIIVSLLYFIIN